jgi:hypothetical protein
MLQSVPTAQNTRQVQVCEVCRLLDGDRIPKWCTWCNQCKAWICDADWKNMPRRMMAAGFRRLGA